LEEATQTLAKVNTREDEEERMAADAEKRKRMLAASNHLLASSSGEPARRVKLLLLGDSGVGKSSLIMRWTLDAFSPSLTSTVGVNFKSKKITYHGELMQVQVWDTAGQENFHKITTSYYKGAQGIMLVYDVSDQKSLDNVEYWIKNIKSHASDSVQVVLVGNKTDLRLPPITPAAADTSSGSVKCIDTERGKDIAKKFSVPFFEVSAKDSSHVDEAFLTLVSHIIDMSAPKHHSAVLASLQGMDRKSLDIRHNSMPNISHSNSPPKNNLTKDSNSSNGNINTSGQTHSGSKDIFKSLGLKKTVSASSPEKLSHSASGGGANGGPTPTGDDKEKCVIS
jgi:small GTP-binding protein